MATASSGSMRSVEATLKTVSTLLVALAWLCSLATAQTTPAKPSQPTVRTEVYHVHVAKAALGKAAQLGDFLKTPDPHAPMPGHFLVLRHQQGDEWDYVVIEHLGPKATIDAAAPAMTPAIRDLYAWHGDTFVTGPSWVEFSRAMGITPDALGKTAGSVYAVSVYRAAPGLRDQLEKMISTPAAANGPAPPESVLLQHLEGAPWQYFGIARYNSWQDFAADQANSEAQMTKTPGQGGWYQLRDYSDFHRDTLTDRIAPATATPATK